jgi:hypothetical protein
MNPFKSFKVCQGCNYAIQKGGVAIKLRGDNSIKHYHKNCLRKKYSRVNKRFFDVAFKIGRRTGEYNVGEYRARKFLGFSF